MPKNVIRYFPWVILLASFAVLAFFYSSLPPEMVITRGLFGEQDTLAPRTVFTVFRVPVIGAICAAAVAIVHRRFLLAAPDLSLFWLIMLYTAACKSLLQALEIVSTPERADAFFYLTIVVVLGGVIWAFLAVRRHFKGFVKGLGKFSAMETLILTLLLIAYVAVGLVPTMVYQ